VGSNLVLAHGTGEGINPEEVSFDDSDAFLQEVSGIAAIAPVLNTSQTVSIRGHAWPLTVLGATPSYAEVRNIVVDWGRFLSEGDQENAGKVATISLELAERLYGGIPPPDATLRLFDLRFHVIGVIREGVESAAAVNSSEITDLTAIVPFSTLRNVTGLRYLDVVYMKAESPEAVPGVVEGVKRVLATRHRSLGSFKVQSLQQYLVLARQVSTALSMVLIAIAGVSLLVGGIGIMNIMLVTVTERTRDIGIRLALGARRRDILAQFLLEAAILSVVGGLVGILVGAGAPLWVGMAYGMPVPVSLASIVVAFGVSVGIGLFFGLYPARKAANMNIVEALVYE
jgi:putative ABC transport system permease protein